MEYKDLNRINENLKTIPVKGKDYIEVNQRVLAFRELFPNGSITTEIIALEDGVVTMKTTVSNEDGIILATGLAQEKEDNGYINKFSFVENCETSAVGRALGFLGIGIDASIASYDEVANAKHQQTEEKENVEKAKADVFARAEWRNKVLTLGTEIGYKGSEMAKIFGLTKDTTVEEFKKVYAKLEKEKDEKHNSAK